MNLEDTFETHDSTNTIYCHCCLLWLPKLKIAQETQASLHACKVLIRSRHRQVASQEACEPLPLDNAIGAIEMLCITAI